MLTNKPPSFQLSCVIKAGLSEFPKMTVTVMKTFFEKLQPRLVNYRSYKCRFRTNLVSESGRINIEENENRLNNFPDACKRTLDIHAPRKQK